jgi:hypothetical protein
MKIQTGIGYSTIRNDAVKAGSEAALAALAGLAGKTPGLIIVFSSPRYDLPAMIAGIRSITGTTHLIGATGSGEIVQGRHLGFGGGVSVLALTAGSYRFGLASAADIKGNLD